MNDAKVDIVTLSPELREKIAQYVEGEHNRRYVDIKLSFTQGRCTYEVRISGYIDPYNEFGRREFVCGDGSSYESVEDALRIAESTLQVVKLDSVNV